MPKFAVIAFFLATAPVMAHDSGSKPKKPSVLGLQPCEISLMANLFSTHLLDQYFTSGEGSENNHKNQQAFFVMMIAMMELHKIEVRPIPHDGFFALKVVPGEKTKMNRLAKRVLEEYGAEIAFSPSSILQSKAGGIMTHWDPAGLRKPVVFIGARTGFTLLGAPLKDTTLLHELRHLKMHADLLAGKPNSLYGEVIAKSGRVPDQFNRNVDGYHGYLSFDEVKTYHTQTKEQLTILRAAMKASHARISVHPQVERLTHLVSLGVIVSGRAVTAANVLKQIRISKPELVKFGRDPADGFPMATAEFGLRSDNSQIKIRLPLPSLDAGNVDRRWEIYDAQATKLHATSTLAFGQFSRLYQALDDLKQVARTGTIEEQLAKLDEMQRMIPMLRM